MKSFTDRSIENYAKSLVKHGLYSTIKEARIESIRWHKKDERGLTEPLKCLPHPDIEVTVEYKDDETIVWHKLPKKYGNS